MPADALVLRKVMFGGWRVSEPWARIGPLALVALWPPVVIPFVVRVDDAPPNAGSTACWTSDFAIAVARGQRRLRRVRVEIVALRIVGTILLVWIAIGIPVATARSGLRGLLLGILGALCISTWLAIATCGALRELGATWRAALRAGGSLVSPFSAMRAPELVVAAALGGLAPLQRVAALVGRVELERWLRPHAWDALHGRAPDAAVALGDAVRQLPGTVLAAATAAPRTNAGREGSLTYCARCATVYRSAAANCASCDGVPLVRTVTPSLP